MAFFECASEYIYEKKFLTYKYFNPSFDSFSFVVIFFVTT